jgi:hypothetical protein
VKRDELKAPTASYGHLRFQISFSDKANKRADCLENHFTACGLCVQNFEVLVKAKDEAVLQIVNNIPSERVRPSDIQNLIILLKLRKACRIDRIPNVKVDHSFY